MPDELGRVRPRTAGAGRPQLTTAQRGYPARHNRIREQLKPLVLAGGVKCARCGLPILPGQAWDLGHDDNDRSRYSGPEHRFSRDCPAGGNRATAARRGLWEPGVVELEPEREGLPANDKRWRVRWLRGLRRPPAGAVWPRLMTVPHPSAVGSLGPAFIAWAEKRSGRELRWWQRLVATRLLEVDSDGRLLWEALILSMARQLGKSWLLRELLLWRIHQGDRFGEPQDVLHTGKDLAVCKEVQRPARVWAKARADTYRVREVNGQEEIELLVDGSRWMLRAKEAVYGYSVSVGAADEAWKVRPSSIDEGLTPTMAEREQPQLLLVSTAHRAATSLMLGRRQAALAQLETGDGDLLIEWSAPAGAELDDIAAWRLASPHWTPNRQRLIEKRLEAMRAGEIEDPEEPDPVESFKAQWLNQWPRKAAQTVGDTEALLPPGLWDELVEQVDGTGPVWVAVEDDYGRGAAVAAARRLDDGRLEVDGWLCPDWDSAIADARRLVDAGRVRQVLVGASLLDRVPAGLPRIAPAGGRETRTGLALLRDLAVNGGLVHDDVTGELDEAVGLAKVKEAPTGLFLIARGPTHLVRALVWAVQAAHKRTKMPAIR
jgi:hypothetical protein